ncbi:hypothetical protein D3C80_967610 [compost metagenome]
MLGAGHRTKHGPQHQPPQQHHEEQAARRRQKGEEGAAQSGGFDAAAAHSASLRQGRQDGDGDQDGGHGHVLGQKDGEGGAARLAVDPPLGRQHRHDHGGRGQGQAHAQNGGAGQGLAQGHEGDGDDQGADGHLKHAQAEDQPAHGLQPFPRQLQPDHEQQEGDAQLRQLTNLGLIADGQPAEPAVRLGEAAQAVGAQQDASRQETEDGADLEPVEQGHDHAGRRQKDHEVPVFAAVRLIHASSVTPHCDPGDHDLAIRLASFMNFF